MITQYTLNKTAFLLSEEIRPIANVRIDNNDISVPLNVKQNGNTFDCTFIINNSIFGLITKIDILDNDSSVISTQTINFEKKAGTLFVGNFKFTITEGS